MSFFDFYFVFCDLMSFFDFYFVLIEVLFAHPLHIFFQLCITLCLHLNPVIILFLTTEGAITKSTYVVFAFPIFPLFFFFPLFPLLFFKIFNPNQNLIAELSAVSPEVSLNEDTCSLSVNLFKHSFARVVQYVVSDILVPILPSLLQKEV